MTIEQDPQHSRETQRRLAQASRYNRRLCALIEPFIRGRVLDIGPGWGNITRHFLDRDIVAVDIDPQYVEHLQRSWGASHGLRAHVCDAADPRVVELLGAGSLDSAMCLNVIEHIPDHAAVLRHVAELLRPGGHFAVVAPAMPWLYGSMDRADGHHRRYRLADMTALFENAGFSVVRREYFNVVGALGWLVYGRILRRPYVPQGRALGLADRVIDFGLMLERPLRPPFGQSLLCVGRR